MCNKPAQAGKDGSSLSPIKVWMKNSPLSESSSKISKSLFINEISDTDFDSIQKIIAETDLSDYQIQPSQFVIMKDKGELLAFGRIFPIGEKEEELGTLWVKEEKRGKKIGLALIQALLEKKRKEQSHSSTSLAKKSFKLTMKKSASILQISSLKSYSSLKNGQRKKAIPSWLCSMLKTPKIALR